MKIITDPAKMRKFIANEKARGRKIGFVPTMGYLHKGHLALIRRAKRENGIVVMSVFVNPAQFGPGEDYTKYPRDFKKDARMAKKEGVNAIFYPAVKSMYLPGHSTYINVEKLSGHLCGRRRSGHFRGVATIVAKLFNIISADNAYFGQKDAQQAVIIKKMAEDLNIPVEIKTIPTVREKDGLAMSSRNAYLNKKERYEATALFKSLSLAKKMIKQGERGSRKIIKTIKDFISKNSSARIDYVSVADLGSLKEIKALKGQVLIAIAAYFGKTRLIDNVILEV
ncbi:MAG: pantoate--beta-alanine ligase [Candidatus Omnitrophica bacterium]|nr:pantoate--beta-alanine ligase [Candidatus Omnitrophota bacterium]MBU4488915.1 pantoate--beta-alanine ligase [Candidatus Omnitrophota bacterium]MCG2705311.1 pantoate--beta-alanine ligase [Candidatus Omnitrophota bacterium]